MAVGHPDWLRLEAAGAGGRLVATAVAPGEATHVSVALYRALEAELQAERERNGRLYEQLRKAIRTKENWRRRALGGRVQQEKWEIRPMGRGYASLRVVELRAEEEGVALAEAERAAQDLQRALGRAVMVGRLYRPGPAWVAELWSMVQPDWAGLQELEAAGDQGVGGQAGGE